MTLTQTKETRIAHKLLSDRWWRLNNLYWIIDKDGNKVKFKPNAIQTRLYNEKWYRNVILKSRQHGITTFICMLFLDACLFSSNKTAEIIAHTLPDANKIFERKIRFAYNNLPEEIKTSIPIKKDRADELTFGNNSSISVSTSSRSRAPNFLHISELAIISLKYPEKAKEIITGCLPSVHKKNIIFIESTADGGAVGGFYNLCKIAENKKQLGKKLTELDFKFHFYSWHEDPKNVINPVNVVIPDRLKIYFDELEKKQNIKLTAAQKAWYTVTEENLGDDMRVQYPSFPDEAFYSRAEGLYYRTELESARIDRRITKVPYIDGVPVYTTWDIGMRDYMAIWFWQMAGRELHFIDCYHNCGQKLAHYADVLDKKGYRYKKHIGPHDLLVRELGTGMTRADSARELGINFFILPKIGFEDGIEQTRQIFSICWFDEEKCDDGIKSLENYRKDWDEKRGEYKDNPRRDKYTHYADAFRYTAIYYKLILGKENKTTFTVSQEIEDYVYT